MLNFKQNNTEGAESVSTDATIFFFFWWKVIILKINLNHDLPCNEFLLHVIINALESSLCAKSLKLQQALYRRYIPIHWAAMGTFFFFSYHTFNNEMHRRYWARWHLEQRTMKVSPTITAFMSVSMASPSFFCSVLKSSHLSVNTFTFLPAKIRSISRKSRRQMIEFTKV